MDLPIRLRIRFDQALKGFAQDLELDEVQRLALASDFGMVALHSLKAQIVTRPGSAPKPIVTVKISLKADVTQECGVSLENFRHDLAHEFSIDCIERHNVSHEVAEIGARELGLNDLDEPDVIEDGQVDLGQYVIEALIEVYDPYARKPGVEFVEPRIEKEPSPFAILAKLNPKGRES